MSDEPIPAELADGPSLLAACTSIVQRPAGPSRATRVISGSFSVLIGTDETVDVLLDVTKPGLWVAATATSPSITRAG
jgi:hypothetical protein